MLQIIGWLGCVYLFVKGLELLSSNAHRTDGKLNNSAMAGTIIAFAGAAVFVFMLNGQASATPFSSESSFSSGAGQTLPADSMSIDTMTEQDLEAVEANLDAAGAAIEDASSAE